MSVDTNKTILTESGLLDAVNGVDDEIKKDGLVACHNSFNKLITADRPITDITISTKQDKTKLGFIAFGIAYKAENFAVSQINITDITKLYNQAQLFFKDRIADLETKANLAEKAQEKAKEQAKLETEETFDVETAKSQQATTVPEPQPLTPAEEAELNNLSYCYAIALRRYQLLTNYNDKNRYRKADAFWGFWIGLFTAIPRAIYYGAISTLLAIAVKAYLEDLFPWDLSFSFPEVFSTNLSLLANPFMICLFVIAATLFYGATRGTVNGYYYGAEGAWLEGKEFADISRSTFWYAPWQNLTIYENHAVQEFANAESPVISTPITTSSPEQASTTKQQHALPQHTLAQAHIPVTNGDRGKKAKTVETDQQQPNLAPRIIGADFSPRNSTISNNIRISFLDFCGCGGDYDSDNDNYETYPQIFTSADATQRRDSSDSIESNTSTP